MQKTTFKSVLTLGFLALLASCSPGNDDDPTPAPAALTLPITIDFANASIASDSTSVTGAGITFHGTSTNDTSGCIDPTGAKFHFYNNNAVELAYPDFNCIIGDLSALPAINKITVTGFDDCGIYTRVRACKDGIVLDQDYSAGFGNKTYTLNLNSQKADKLIIQSCESYFSKIVIE